MDVAGIVPQGEKKLRACLITGLIKSEEQARPAVHRPLLPSPVREQRTPRFVRSG